MKIVKIKQHDITDCGAACLVSVAGTYGKLVLLSQARELCQVDKQGSSMLGLLSAAKLLGFKAEGVQGTKAEQFKDIPLPAIAHIVIENRLQHYVVVYEATDSHINVMDPGIGDFKTYSHAEFEAIWQNNHRTIDP